MAGHPVSSQSVYIDPANCSSTVSWRIYENYEHLNGEVEIADCNHKVSWSFDEGGDTSGLEKIDVAIAALMEFRKAFSVTLRERAKAKAAAKK